MNSDSLTRISERYSVDSLGVKLHNCTINVVYIQIMSLFCFHCYWPTVP